MTNLEALQSVIGVNYPFEQNTYIKALIDQKLNPTDDYVFETSAKGVDLAFAGILITVITAVDIKEGGYQVTNADRATMLKLINGIYTKYDLPLFGAQPVLKNASFKW